VPNKDFKEAKDLFYDETLSKSRYNNVGVKGSTSQRQNLKEVFQSLKKDEGSPSMIKMRSAHKLMGNGASKSKLVQRTSNNIFENNYYTDKMVV